MVEVPQHYNGKPLVHAWIYCATDGAPFGVVGRYQNGSNKKNIVPFFKRNGSSWTAGIDLTPRPLFGLDKLAAQSKDKAVFIVEGEKAAAALHSIGICAVSSLGGSQAATKADWTPLDGYKLAYLMPDNDEPGEHYARDVYTALSALELPPDVKLARLSGLPEGGDVVDWLQNHAPEWDGLQPFPTTEQAWALSELRSELKKAEPIPEEWNLAILAGSCSGVFDWEKPHEIETKTPAVQALPPELIPESFRPWLADVSNRMQTPPDFAAISAIVITGSIIGAGCGMRPKRLDDWEVIPNVWGACIGRPSVVLKSPSMNEATKLLDRLQADYGERYEQEKAGAEFDGLATKAMLDDVKSQLSSKAKGKGKDRAVNPDDLQKLKADYVELAQNATPEPTRRLFKTNETSIQSMTVLQSQNPRGILVFRDELIALLVKWDREDGADERAYFLEGWNGNGSYTDCKIGRGITDAKQICISLLGGIQPDKLKRYLYQAMQGNNDGLMQRLQLAVWPDEPERWQLVDTIPNKADKQRAFNIMQALAEMDFIQYGAKQGEYDDRPYFRFDESGQAVFNDWLTELQTIKLQREENPLMVEHFGKFRSLMPSLALIFHCIDIADSKASGPVTAKAALLAVEWCKYLESHARRIYAMAESPEHEAAVRLADKIKAKALPSPFTCKAVYDKGWHGLKDRHEVEAACNILIDENWLMMERKPATGNRGRPPLPEYHINPTFL
jgi:5S rRNA maturation endonuclease (ribonuclease M5)